MLGRVRGRVDGPRGASFTARSVAAYSTARSASGLGMAAVRLALSRSCPGRAAFAFKDRSDARSRLTTRGTPAALLALRMESPSEVGVGEPRRTPARRWVVAADDGWRC